MYWRVFRQYSGPCFPRFPTHSWTRYGWRCSLGDSDSRMEHAVLPDRLGHIEIWLAWTPKSYSSQSHTQLHWYSYSDCWVIHQLLLCIVPFFCYSAIFVNFLRGTLAS
ncbi:hypothetical protein COOONC_26781 [Cooperia oncophora]